MAGGRCPPGPACHFPLPPSPVLGRASGAEEGGQPSPGGASPAPAPPHRLGWAPALCSPNSVPPRPCTHPAPSRPGHLGCSQIPTRWAGPRLGPHCSRDNARTKAGALGRGSHRPHPASVTLAGVTGHQTSLPHTWAETPGLPHLSPEKSCGRLAGRIKPLSPPPRPRPVGAPGGTLLADESVA